MLETIKEAVSFLVFGFLLMVVCYGNQHPARYQFTKSVSNIFSQRFQKVSGRCCKINVLHNERPLHTQRK